MKDTGPSEFEKIRAEFEAKIAPLEVKQDTPWEAAARQAALARQKAEEAAKRAELAELKKFRGKKILEGVAASPGIAVGVVRNVQDRVPELMAQIKPGEVLVAPILTVSDYPYMEKASAFVLNLGGSAGGIDFLTKVAKQTGKPAVVATGEATSVLKDGQNVVVDGDDGAVYAYKAKAIPKPGGQ